MNKLRVIRRNNENKDGSSPLFVSFYINREKVRIPLGLSCTEKEWDSAQERFVGRGKNVADKNLIISSMLARISDIFVKARLRDEKLSIEEFKKRFKNPTNFTTFIDFANNYYKLLAKGNTDNTNKVHRSVLKKLYEFKPSLAFSEVTTEFFKIYNMHLRRLGNADTTIWKNISTLKIYVRAAVAAGYIRVDPFANYKVRHPKNEIICLSEDELKQMISLYNSGLLPENEQDVLRFFLFMCFTSLHVSDAKALRVENIFANELHYVRKKTRQVVIVPMSVPAMRLYEYYRDGRNKGALFNNMPTDQAINRVLKRIAAKLEINKPITCKTARHTFATIYCTKNNGDITTLSRIMGHSSISMTMVYTHTLKENRMEGIKVFDEF